MATYADLADLRVAETLIDGFFLESFADDRAFIAHPSLFFVPNPANSDTVKIPELGLRTEQMTDNPEGTPIVPSNIPDSSFTVTVARKGIGSLLTDKARLTGGLLRDGSVHAIRSAAAAYRKLAAMAAAAGAASPNISLIGGPMTVSALLVGANAQEGRDVPSGARKLALVDVTSWGQLRADVWSLQGTGQELKSIQGLAEAWGKGYVGSIGEIDIVVVSDALLRAAGISSNLLLGPNAIAWSTKMQIMEEADRQMILGGGADIGLAPAIPVLLERERSGAAGETTWFGSCMLGASIGLGESVEVIKTS